MTVDTAREIALKILYDINEKGAYSNISINKYLEGYQLRDVDKAFITELIYGTVKWKLTIDWIISQYSSVKLKRISPWILNIIRLGVYQLVYTDRIPESAACNESVKLSKKYGHEAASRFVNGVLRNIARSGGNFTYPDKGTDFVRYLSVRYSHPQWMVKEWLTRFGADFTESLLEANNQVPEFYIRTNTLKLTRDKLIDVLRKEGVNAEPGKYHREAVVIKNPSSITKLESFNKGYFQVQDVSSMLVGCVLDAKENETVIDVCSAPGGKATHIAQMMNNSGTVIARDIHEHKIKIIDETVKRLGLNNVKTELFDALKQDEKYFGKADRVLVDAPCTGLGIIRRKPDIKWSRNEKDTREIAQLQKIILETASKYVKPGGVLVYSTCTIQNEENENIVRKFTEKNRDFKLVDISGLLPEELKKSTALEGYIQLFPNIDNIDGFFIARMERRG